MKKGFLFGFFIAIFLLVFASAASINLDWIYPTAEINVTQSLFFNVSVNVSCSGGDCGQINVTLDPDSWWNSNWGYRRQINITETSGNNLAGYPIKINLTTQNFNYSRTAANGTDLRFTDSSSNILNHWIQIWNPLGTSTIWVNLTSLSSRQTSQIYMYYGNNTAVSNSANGDLVFDFFDDFNDASLNSTKWNSSLVSASLSNSLMILKNSGGSNGGIASTRNFSISGNISYTVFFMSKANANNGYNNWGFSKAFPPWDTRAGIYAYPPSFGTQNVFGTGSNCGASFASTDTAYHNISVELNSRFLFDNSIINWCDINATAVYVQITTWGSGTNITVDYVYLRKRAPTEPNFTISAEEASSSSKGTISTNSSATPFYTNVTNPYNLTLNQDQSQIITWWVNASGTTPNYPYEFFVYANATSNLSIGNQTSRLNITIKDITSPTINITYPLSNANYTFNISAINYTYSDYSGAGRCWYSNSSGIWNSTTQSSGNNFANVITIDGSNTFTLYCNDSSGNLNSTSVTFTRDVVYPIFSNYGGNNATMNGSGIAILNVTILNSNGTVWLEINGTNYTANNISSNVWNYSLFLVNGTYSYKWHSWGNFSLANYNVSRTLNYTIYNNLIIVNISAMNASNVSGVAIQQGASVTITSYIQNAVNVLLVIWRNFIGGQILWQGAMTAVGNLWSVIVNTNSTWPTGQINYTIYANDSLRNTFNMSGTFNVTDTTPPAVYLKAPANGTISTSTTQYFAANYTENVLLLNATLYIWNSTNSTINITTQSISGVLNQTNISVILPYNDRFKWNYYVCDNLSNCAWNSTNYTLIYDNTAPIINITYPLNTTYNINVNQLNYTYSDSNPSKCWYSNNSGLWNSTIQNATLNFTSVSSIEGTNTWTLYCNDTAGNLNYTSVTFAKTLPKIGLSLVSPTGNINATLNQFFQVQVNVSCSDANCGNVNVTLDPSSTIYNFTTCGASGRTGPNQTQCNTNYTGTTLAGLVGVDSTGIQNWTVPSGITSITITAKGASGGYVSGYTPGYGTLMTGTFAVTPSQIIFILVGQTPGLTSAYTGGGGGTFVATGNNYSSSSVLIVAGGGGGAYSATGINASVGINGTGSSPGTNGNGAPASSCGGGGGGFNSSGANDTGYGGDVHAGGIGFKQGGAGGSNKAESSYQSGGFGGGAVANWHGDCYNRGGAGGGYSGGSGYGPGSGNGAAYGQAGGSYNNGTSQNNSVSRVYGDGYVTITASGGKGGTVSMNTSATPFYTTTQNPYNLTLNNGESQVITWNVNATGTINQSYTFFVYANLTSDTSIGNITALWNVTIVNQTGETAPSVTIIYPQNTNYTINVSELNYSVSGTNLSACWYSLNGGANSTPYSPGTNWTGLTSNEGSNVWIAYCNNTNLTGSGSVTFYKDTILPNLTLNSPGESYINSTTSSINITFNCSVADNLGLKNISLYITNSSNANFALNKTTNITGISNNTNWTLTLGAGNYTWNCLASDSLGNSNWSVNRAVLISSLDSIYPIFTNIGFNYSNASVYTIGRIYSANSTITNTNTTAGIEFNGINYSATNVSSLFTSTIGQLSAGTYSYYWWAYGNGTNKNYNTTQVYYYTINQSTGNVSGFINNSASNFTVWNGTANRNIWLNATNITGYGTGKIYLNGTLINLGTMPLSNLTNLSVGYYNVTFVYDGNTNYTSNTKVLWVNVSVYVDTIYPIFSNYGDNNATLTGNGTAIFNVTILNTNRSVWLEINGTNYTANNISANTWNYSLFLVNGTYSYRWWAYGNGTSNNLNNSGNRSYTIINPDLVPPAITIISPANATYNENIIYFNLSSNENLSLCKLTINNWATNYTMTINSSRTGANYTSGELSDGSYVARFWCNDTSNNINNSETVTFVLNASAVIINSFSIYPYSAINGSNIYIYTSVTKAQGIFANITLPNGTINLVTLTNNSNTSFSSTNLVGRYNVTIFGNNSFGGFASSSDYFETFMPIIFNISIIDRNNTGINNSWSMYYRNQQVISNRSQDGRISRDIPNSMANLEIKAYSDNFQVLLRDINLTKETNKTFGIDDLSTPVSGYLLTYGVENNFSFTNATIKVNYSQINYTNESYLGLYKCNSWNFANQTCESDWTSITNSSTQDMQGDLFEYLTTSFSGFSVKQEPYCGDSSCNNGETCSSCSSDCGACATSPSGGSGGGGGGGGSIKYECIKQSDCNKTYTCYNHKCVKLFDAEIIEVKPLINSLDFELKYLIKGMAEFNGDVIIKFWAQNKDEKIELGKDTIYLGAFEEKIKTTKLNLPKSAADKDYDLYIQVSFEDYSAESFRKINLNLLKEQEKEEIILGPIENASKIAYSIFMITILAIIITLFSLKRYRRTTVYYIHHLKDESKVIQQESLGLLSYYLRRAKINFFLLWIDTIKLIGDFFNKARGKQAYERKSFIGLIYSYIGKIKRNMQMIIHYIFKIFQHKVNEIKKGILRNMDFVIGDYSIMIYPAWIIKKPRYIKEKCCISNLKGKRVYTLSGHLVGEIVQPVLSLGKINGWLITPDRRYHLDKSVFILHKEIIAIGEIVFVHRRVSEYLHNYNEMHKEKIHIEKTFTENKKIKEYAKKISIKKQQANHRKLEEIILRVAENLNKKFKKRVEKAKDNIFYFVVWLKNKLNRKEDKKEILYERVL